MVESKLDETSFCHWLKGFGAGLDDMDQNSRSCLLRQCAKSCADTGVLQAYRKLYQTVKGDRNAFYARLGDVGNVRGEVVVPDREYYVCFPACSCDLHTAGGVNTPRLCECSRQSIIYVGEQVWKGSSFRVEQVETILSGARECKFRIVFE